MRRYRKLFSGHLWTMLRRQMSWTLRRNARDIDNRCPDIVDRRIVFIFHLGICQQCPDNGHQCLLFSVMRHTRKAFNWNYLTKKDLQNWIWLFFFIWSAVLFFDPLIIWLKKICKIESGYFFIWSAVFF